MTEDLIKEKLMISEEEITKKLLDKVAQFVKFTSDGNIYIVPKKKLTDEEEIGLYLIGKHFANAAGVVGETYATRGELEERLGIDRTIVSARIQDLKNEGYVDSPSRGQYVLSYMRIGAFLDKIAEKGTDKQ